MSRPLLTTTATSTQPRTAGRAPNLTGRLTTQDVVAGAILGALEARVPKGSGVRIPSLPLSCQRRRQALVAVAKSARRRDGAAGRQRRAGHVHAPAGGNPFFVAEGGRVLPARTWDVTKIPTA